MAESSGSDQAGIGNLIETHLKKVYIKINKELASRKHVDLKKSCEAALGTPGAHVALGLFFTHEILHPPFQLSFALSPPQACHFLTPPYHATGAIEKIEALKQHKFLPYVDPVPVLTPYVSFYTSLWFSSSETRKI